METIMDKLISGIDHFILEDKEKNFFVRLTAKNTKRDLLAIKNLVRLPEDNTKIDTLDTLTAGLESLINELSSKAYGQLNISKEQQKQAIQGLEHLQKILKVTKKDIKK